MNYELLLSTGKKVVIREPQIRDQDSAASAVSSKAGDSAMNFALLLQTELTKSLIVSIDGKVLSGLEKESLDKVFSYKEYSELLLGIREILGEAKKPQISIVKESSGDK